jgi:hypothetical protein
MAMTTDDPEPWLAWIEKLIVAGQERTEARFDRLDSDVSGLKADVADVKATTAVMVTDVGRQNDAWLSLSRHVSRIEAATNQTFARLEVKIEPLAAYLKRLPDPPE